jgi:hypothetical protein
MYKYVLIFSLTVLSLLCNSSALDFNSDCAKSDNPLACRGANFFGKALNQVISNYNDETVRLLPGLEIVQNDNINKVYHENDERSMPAENENFVTRIAKYLQTHDLKIKFSDLVGKTDLTEIVNNVFNNDDPAIVGKQTINANYMISWIFIVRKSLH